MDDFAPRYEYPESMRKLEEYLKKSGHNYGKYVEEHPDELKPKAEEKKIRICRKCGKEFEVKKLKNGLAYSSRVRCEECIGTGKKEYKLICQDCGKEMTAPTPRKKRCDECKVLYQRELTRRNRERKSKKKD